jgi:SAM-dependent methyltransferase
VYRALAEDPARWGRVVDLGCGPGLTALLALARGDADAYLGIDLDEYKLRVARRALALGARPLDQAWRLVRATLPLAAPPPDRFDTALVIDVLHYWPRDGQLALLRQARSLLVDGGTLWLRDGVATGGDAGLVAGGERFTTRFGLNPPNELHFLSRDAIEAMLVEAGFESGAAVASGAENLLWRCRAVAIAEPGAVPT